MRPYITFTVPAYNSSEFLHTCIDSLLIAGEEVQIIIVNDGSTDNTGEIADKYARLHKNVEVIHKENGGHGSGVNAGLAAAKGYFFKVVDSDDCLDEASLKKLMETIETLVSHSSKDGLPDVVITDYVRVNQRTNKHRTMHYRRAFVENQLLGWDDIGKTGRYQELMMHTLLYRLDMLQEIGLKLPGRMFYVDCLYAFIPLFHVQKIYYMSLPLYRYTLGRDGQSVSKSAVFRNIDQLLTVVSMMTDAYLENDKPLSRKQDKLLKDKVAMLMCIASVHLKFMETKEAKKKNKHMYFELKRKHRPLYRHSKYHFGGIFASASNPVASTCAKAIYNAIDLIYKVN
jgi:glycosyltransferase involved in cell wall biosynthesis